MTTHTTTTSTKASARSIDLDGLRAAMAALESETIHFRNTGLGRQFVRNAISQLNREIAKISEAIS